MQPLRDSEGGARAIPAHDGDGRHGRLDGGDGEGLDDLHRLATVVPWGIVIYYVNE